MSLTVARQARHGIMWLTMKASMVTTPVLEKFGTLNPTRRQFCAAAPIGRENARARNRLRTAQAIARKEAMAALAEAKKDCRNAVDSEQRGCMGAAQDDYRSQMAYARSRNG